MAIQFSEARVGGPSPRKRRPGWRRALLAAAFLLAPGAAADNPPLVLLIQPLPPEERSAPSFEPLARYIEVLTGRRCTTRTSPNFPVYWNALRRNDYDIALDAPHFTDYRVHKFGFTVLAKTADNASYSLITHATGGVLDPMQLVGRRIASLGLLSTGTTRLGAMFPDSARQPVLVEAHNTEEALTLLRRKRVAAVFLPTAAVNEPLSRGGLTMVLTTEPVARLILSASPRLAADLKESIRDGLLQADRTEGGQNMLREIGLARFEPAPLESYANQRVVLKSYWGY